MPKLTQEDEDTIASIYQRKEASQQELADLYKCSRTCIRNALQKYSLAVNNRAATPDERKMLGILNGFGIATPSQLNSILCKGS